MIGKLKGLVDTIDEDHIILDVQGVGYVVFLPLRVFGSLPEQGQKIELFIETQVREDAIRLFGFKAKSEQLWFRLLQNVQGVGAKVALAIIGTLSPSEIANAIALRDIAMISRAPGVGKRVAERIVSELKNKAPALSVEGVTSSFKQDVGEGVTSQPILDAVSALENLGYSRDMAADAIALAVREAGNDADSAKLIRLGLKELSR
ncbi:Holliday junction branch migration protein RuvA [Bartonella tamiae]|uniref:Holliday junction branch migration complex subunit RuvA n=1 Tax=Bartonella tamiae Th239 TaxID=1094558 RepID=J1K2M9_9HYPH|nr:Holliday junction branch migration protein RuvA [Bartonella tamiae]EJF91742.1 Holliday junction DNA helicase RuvA [Bartonella tamiae Th239]EJF92590.1 Holliday junction DNA helicase RuvA [Bartonella tamiae Th307]